jgi:hypothetical protein
MVKLISQKAMNTVVSHLDEVRDGCHQEAKGIEHAASALLEEARASTRWHKIIGPGHLTNVDSSQGEVDSFANLNAPNPMAIEFGHEPSGVYAGTPTKAPEGLYILHKASGFGLE